jgi:hypothetical protein
MTFDPFASHGQRSSKHRHWKWLLLFGSIGVVIVVACVWLVIWSAETLTTSATGVYLQTTSPDARLTAVGEVVERHALPMPGPEPPRTNASLHTLRVLEAGNVIFSSPTQDLGKGADGKMDIAWARDSSRFAYRLLTSLHVVEPRQQRMRELWEPPADSFISTFRWIDDRTLAVLTRHVPPPASELLTYGYPDFTLDSTGATLWRIGVPDGPAEQIVTVPIASQPCLIRGALRIDELAPDVPLVAIHDGNQLLVYDFQSEQFVLRQPVAGPVHGVWWADADTVVLSINNLSGLDTARFLVVQVSRSQVVDVTDQLLPLWTGLYDDLRWFEQGLGSVGLANAAGE